MVGQGVAGLSRLSRAEWAACCGGVGRGRWCKAALAGGVGTEALSARERTKETAREKG